MSGNQVFLLYAISIIVVFLSRAALYESWTIPCAVLMEVPTGARAVRKCCFLIDQRFPVFYGSTCRAAAIPASIVQVLLLSMAWKESHSYRFQ